MLRDKNVIYGRQDIFVPAHLNYGQFALDRFLSFGNELALINAETGKSITYREVAQLIVNCSYGLGRLGVKKGDVIGLMCENRTEFMVSVFAALCSGAVFTTLNPAYTTGELQHVLNISKPKYVIASSIRLEKNYDTFRQCKFVSKIIHIGEDKHYADVVPYTTVVSEHVDIDSFEAVDVKGQEDVAAIMYSSGTTGLPKGVIFTHLNFFITPLSFNADDLTARGILRMLTVVPWVHAYGLIYNLSYLAVGRTMVYLPKFNRQQYFETIQKFKINYLFAVPSLIISLTRYPDIHKYDLSSVVAASSSTAPLLKETCEAFKAKFTNLKSISSVFGMTESGIAVDPQGLKMGSVGHPMPTMKIKIVDLETEKSLGPNEKGEIRIKGLLLSPRYIGPNIPSDAYDRDGFFRTGDIGYYDNDQHLFVVNRIKELIKYKGNHVAPAEIESVIDQHPGVVENAVIGMPDVQGISGELPTAFVVKDQGAGITEKEIIDHVARKLSPSKHLHGGVRFIDSLPRSANGKVLRRVLRDKYTTKSKL